ncbi:MAG: MFS transporter [Hyphomicrobiales bacterium]|nr:MAG: MFS transporter [Hyphomicrobiales bacterium]
MIKPHYRVFACFFLFAMALGALLGRLPDIQHNLDLTESQLGMMLIGMAVGSLISLSLGARWVDRMGARLTAFITVIGTAFCYALIPWLPSAWLVFATLLVAGVMAGLLEINLNLEADRIEAQLDKRVMNRAHGMWSLGFFVTALIAAAMRQADIAVTVHTAAAFVVVVLASLIVLPGMTNAPHRPDTLAHEEGTHRIALPNLGLLPLCIIAIAAFLVEGTGIDWSVIYMRDVFEVTPFIGGLSLTVFTGLMALGRLFADPVVDRFGPRAVATTMLAIAAVGSLVIGIAPHPWLAIAGFGMIGLGCSCVYPLTVSAAAQRTDRPASVNVAALAQVSFVVFFLGPPLLGFVAEHLGIRLSYLFVLPVIVVGLLLSGSLDSKRAAKTDA